MPVTEFLELNNKSFIKLTRVSVAEMSRRHFFYFEKIEKIF